MSFRVERAGSAALAALRSGTATVFAAFERSCYVETPAGIACLGGSGLGMGPLNVTLADSAVPSLGEVVRLDFSSASHWKPLIPKPGKIRDRPRLTTAWASHPEAQAFLDWLAGAGKPDDALIGLGPGLTPAGDDFVGGAMIALRAWGRGALADRIAAWALPLARKRTNRISRAHLECAAAGEGHEALHDWLATFAQDAYERLSRIGHTSGLDAAAGALLALQRTGASISAGQEAA